MSEGKHARGTQFQGFAKALNRELSNRSLELFARENSVDAKTLDREFEQIIARRAYDLVRYTIVELSCQDAINFSDPDFDKYEYRAGEMVEIIPDLTELSKEQEA